MTKKPRKGKKGVKPQMDVTQPIESNAGEDPAQKDVAAIRAEEEKVALKWDVGDVILDLYEVKHIHPTGGMGLVYRVHHRGWDIDLAVKSPREEYFQTEQQKENFRKECESWIDLGLHPNIVSCYYVRSLGGIPRVFAEYMDGGSLLDWIKDGRLYKGDQEQALERILDIAIQFAWGLHYAHEQDLVHQDVKPANILMGQEGTAKVKITDFGLARARALTVESSMRSGQRSNTVTYAGLTPAYCSPEQANKEKLTHKTDIWSWAVSILEMFTGEAYWQAGQAANEVFNTYLDTGSDNEAIPMMPDSLAELLRQCFLRDPADRPKDMQEIVNRLKQIYRQVAEKEYFRPEPEPAELLADGLNNRAISMLDLGNQEGAEALWQEALDVESHHLESTYNRGVLLWRSARSTDDVLVQKMNEVCASHPNAWQPACLLAQIHLERDDCESAIEVLNTIQGTDSAHGEVVRLRALATDRLANSRKCLSTFMAHEWGAESVCMSEDGRYLLSGGSELNDLVRLWDAAAGRCLRTFEGHTKAVYSVSLTRDGHYGLSGSSDNTLKLWEIETGRCLRTFEGHTDCVKSVHLSEDGKYAVSGGNDNTIRLWDVALGRCTWTLKGHSDFVSTVRLSRDGRFVLSGGGRDYVCKLWEAATGHCLLSFRTPSLNVSPVRWSWDGKWVLCGGDDGMLTLWDVETGRCIHDFKGTVSSITSADISRDKRYVLSAGTDDTIRLWDVSTCRCIRTYEGHTGIIQSVCLSADGKWAASAGGDYDGTIRLWRVDGNATSFDLPVALSYPVPIGIALLAKSGYQRALEQAREAMANGDILAAAQSLREARSQPGCQRRHDGINEWWKLYTRLPIRSFVAGWQGDILETQGEEVESISLSGDGRLALSITSFEIKLWDVASCCCVRTFGEYTEIVYSVHLSSDGKYALSGYRDGMLRLWDVATGTCLQAFKGHTEGVSSVWLSAGGKYALSGSSDKTLRLWDLTAGAWSRIFGSNEGADFTLCMSSDGQYFLSASHMMDMKSLKLWNLATGECVRIFEGHTHPQIRSACFSGDGRLVLSGSVDKTIKLWDVATGQCIRTFEGHADSVNSVSLSQDGRYALSGSSDKTIKLWHVETGRCLRTFEGHRDSVNCVCLSKDSRYALSGSSDGSIRLWCLDWELEDKQLAEWDEGARPYLENFLTLHAPYAAELRKDREPPVEEIILALTRRGKPRWTEEDFKQLLYTLGCAGYGWLRPEGVRKKLEEIAADWKGPPNLLET